MEYSSSESIVVHMEFCNYCEAENFFFENVTSIAGRFQHLLDIWNERRSVNQAKSILYDIFDRIERDQNTSMSSTAFSACVRYMDEHFCEADLNIEKICHLEFISVSTLQRAFGEYFGVSPKQYLIKLRMNHAFELLAEDRLSVREVAAACGFTDEKYFSRAFKKKYGYSPSQLRERITV